MKLIYTKQLRDIKVLKSKAFKIVFCLCCGRMNNLESPPPKTRTSFHSGGTLRRKRKPVKVEVRK
jgi:hypothetical protein